MAQMNMIQALNSAMDVAMGRDPNVVATNNDAFGQAVPVLTAASIRLQGPPRPI